MTVGRNKGVDAYLDALPLLVLAYCAISPRGFLPALANIVHDPQFQALIREA